MSIIGGYLSGISQIDSTMKVLYERSLDRFIQLNICDLNFTNQLIKGTVDQFWERVWESNLGQYLYDKGYNPKPFKDSPDFWCSHEIGDFWVEAICPKNKSDISGWPFTPGIHTVNQESIMLCWTSAIKEKRDKLEGNHVYSGYRKTGKVNKNDPYIIAVNSTRLGGSPASEIGFSGFPYSAQICFGIGDIAIPLNKDNSLGDPINKARLSIKSKNNSPVNTAIFLEESYSGVSGIFSTGSLAPYPTLSKYIYVNNPNASNPVDISSIASESYLSNIDNNVITIVIHNEK